MTGEQREDIMAAIATLRTTAAFMADKGHDETAAELQIVARGLQEDLEKDKTAPTPEPETDAHGAD